MAYRSETKLTVRYAETDMMGIVHHSRYYPWFEIARTDFIKASGRSYTEMEQMGILLPVTQTSAEYHHGLRYEDEVLVTAELESLSVARCGFVYKVYLLPTRQLMVEGRTGHGFVDEAFKPMNLKKKYPQVWEDLSKLL